MAKILHTQEPWIQGMPDFGMVYCLDGNVIAITEMHSNNTEANAARIVACVNAHCIFTA